MEKESPKNGERSEKCKEDKGHPSTADDPMAGATASKHEKEVEDITTQAACIQTLKNNLQGYANRRPSFGSPCSKPERGLFELPLADDDDQAADNWKLPNVNESTPLDPEAAEKFAMLSLEERTRLKKAEESLAEACRYGDIDIVKELLEEGVKVNKSEGSEESPLVLAVRSNQMELVMMLLDNDADIEELDDMGYSPLMNAAMRGFEGMTALLLSQSAYIDAKVESTQETAITLAYNFGFPDVVYMLALAGAEMTPEIDTYVDQLALEASRKRDELYSNTRTHTTSLYKSQPPTDPVNLLTTTFTKAQLNGTTILAIGGVGFMHEFNLVSPIFRHASYL